MAANTNTSVRPRRASRTRAIVNTALLCLLFLVATGQIFFGNVPVVKVYFERWWWILLCVELALLLLFFAINVRPTPIFLLKCLLHLVCTAAILVIGYRTFPDLYVAAQIPVFGPAVLTLSILITIGIVCVLRILEEQDSETVQSIARLASFGHIVWTTWQEMSSGSAFDPSLGTSTQNLTNQQQQQDQDVDLEN